MPALIFDLDGTLVDTVYAHVFAWQKALQESGMAVDGWRIHRKIGMSGGLFTHQLLRETDLEMTPERADRLRRLHAEAYGRLSKGVVPLPGACAAIAALSAAGLPSDRFCYEGFLPAKTKGRCDALRALVQEPRTLIFYESTHRLIDSLQDMVSELGAERYVVLARELTKTWESIYGAPVGELLAWVKEDENRRKGEMVLIVEGYKVDDEDALPADALRTLALLQKELPLKRAAALTAEIHSVKKNALYKYALEQQEA